MELQASPQVHLEFIWIFKDANSVLMQMLKHWTISSPYICLVVCRGGGVDEGGRDKEGEIGVRMKKQ